MCLEEKDLKHKEADCCRKEVGKNLTIVTTLLEELKKLTHVHVMKNKQAGKR